MMDNTISCSCTDTNCKLHPSNHNLGCDPCIKKNLKAGEIPGCFFHLVKDDLSQVRDFTIGGVAKLYMENK
ncbi:MAG: hypothetical protein K0R54_5429 [Clostridiaceae bacterium]|jgi:hypothetical protein|nr:hypothetical protein [Clostridiaceae bacterium]